MENELIQKPSFDENISIEIKTLGEITSNMARSKEQAKQLLNYYSNVIYTEDTMKAAKEEKSKINKAISAISQKRKDTISEFNKPIKEFEILAKETESILKDTYNAINTQVISYENKQKQQKEQEIIDYFNEYKAFMGIDFISFDDAKINVTLTASVKSLKEKVKEFIERINRDLELIDTEPNKEEVLVEYKQNLDITKSIATVRNRQKLIEIEKEVQERQKREAGEMQEHLSNFVKEQNEEQKIELPVEENITKDENEILNKKYVLRGKRSDLKELLRYAENLNIEIYEED